MLEQVLLAVNDGEAVENAMRKHIAEAREFHRARLGELTQNEAAIF